MYIENASICTIEDSEEYLNDYYFVQCVLAIESCRLSGNQLNALQVPYLLTFGSLPEEWDYRQTDVDEMNGHFDLFDMMLDSVEESLTEDTVKAFYCELTKDISTVIPEDVSRKIKSLFDSYNAKDIVFLEDIAKLHADFDLIHPFPKGNGRIGRMILFRECMSNDFPLFLIEFNRREEYFAALEKAKEDKNYSELTNFFISEQDTFDTAYKNWGESKDLDLEKLVSFL